MQEVEGKKKKHLHGLNLTLCGRKGVFISFAKKYSEVTCKSCMQSENYKRYLAGKFGEKPLKSQTQGYLDITSGK